MNILREHNLKNQSLICFCFFIMRIEENVHATNKSNNNESYRSHSMVVVKFLLSIRFHPLCLFEQDMHRCWHSNPVKNFKTFHSVLCDCDFTFHSVLCDCDFLSFLLYLFLIFFNKVRKWVFVCFSSINVFVRAARKGHLKKKLFGQI